MKHISILLSAIILAAGCDERPKNDLARVFSYKVGKVEIVQLTDQEANISPSILNVKDPDNYTGLTPDKGFVNATSSYMLRSGDKKYLFDTGIGDWMSTNMHGIGEHTRNIQKIFFTHLHMDHFGRMIWQNSIMYPNAQLYIPKAEFEYWTSDENLAANPNNGTNFLKVREMLEAYKDRITLFEPASIEAGGTVLEDGITAFAAPGHTPGHTMYLIESGKKKLLIWGDITHATYVQVAFPEVSVRYDIDPKQAAETRRKVLEFAAANKIPVAGMHIVYPGIGTITEKDGQYTFKPVRARYRPFTGNQ